MSTYDLHDHLNRTVKMALDSGEVDSLEEAERLFEGYRLGLAVGPEVERSPTLQAAVLTAVNTGARAFLGGISVAGFVNGRLLIPWQRCETLADAVHDLGGEVVTALPEGVPVLCFGTPDTIPAGRVRLRATFEGWSAGVVPLEDERGLPEQTENVIAGVACGALGVSEAFQYVRGYPVAGRRAVGLSLWEPGANWMQPAEGPSLDWLPSRLWLIGLGHLGQAFLWVLGFLPYANPCDVELVLQDDDVLVDANLSTSPLTKLAMIGQKKARAMAAWCEERGFRTTITERRFTSALRRNDGEPDLALCGVDNAAARAALDDAGFDRVIEAGLGAGVQEYLAFQVHTFPGLQVARERWGNENAPSLLEAHELPEGYHSLENELDACGLMTLAGRAVGASFVGTAVGSIVIAQAVRMVRGETYHGVVDGTLRAPQDIEALAAGLTIPMKNLGYAQAAHGVID